MKLSLKLSGLPKFLLVIPVLLIFAILVVGFWFYQFQYQQTRDSLEDDLNTVARLKIDQITSWRNERLGDATLITADHLFITQISNWQQTQNSHEEQDILNDLQNFVTVFHYSDVVLLDSSGKVLLSTSGSKVAPSKEEQAYLQIALQERKGVLTSLYLEPLKNKPRMDGIAPLYLIEGDVNILVGAILLRIDPTDFLYPSIQTWPSKTQSGETLLIKRDGNDVLYLNELRHRSNTALTFKVPISQVETPAVKAVLGAKGFVTGKDYRGVDVLASVGPLPNSDWFLVAKLDSAEAYADMNVLSVLILALVFGTLFSVLSVVTLVILQVRRKQSQVIYMARIAQLQVEQELVFTRLLMGRSSDALFVIDPETSRVLDANETACERLGYTREELMELIVSDFGLPYSLEQWVSIVQTVKVQGSMVIETTHRRKDGTAFPVEISKTYVEASGKGYLIESVRDITERKLVEDALYQSEERFRLVAECSPDVIWTMDLSGHFTYVSPSVEQLRGYTVEEVLSQSIEQALTPESAPIARTGLEDVIQANEKGESRQVRHVLEQPCKDGSTVWTEVSTSIMYDANRQFKGILGITRDITERRQAEQALNLAHKQTTEILESINDAFYALDSEERFTYVNSKAEEMYRRRRSELIGKYIWDVFPAMVGGEPYKNLRRALTEQVQVETVAYSELIKEWVEVRIYPSGGGISVYIRDITARKNMEEALRRSETLYRMLARHLPDSAVLVFDRDLRYLVAEGGALSRNGYSPEMLEGKTLQEVAATEEVSRLLPYYQAALSGLENTFEEYSEEFVFLVKVVPIRDQEGTIVGGMLFRQDITSLKRAEQYLSNEKERLSVTLRSIGDGVITTDLEGRITLLNRVAENLTGWSQAEAVGKPLAEVFQLLYEDTHLLQESPIQETLATGQVLNLRNHTLLLARDGTQYSIADSCAPIRNRDSNIIGAVLVFRDVTAELKLKEELQKTAKLESLGIFAGGLAHDFNNLLSGIIGYLDLTRLYISDQKMPESTEAEEYISQALAAATRAKDLTIQLLTFSKGGTPVKKVVELSSIIEESARFMLHGTNVESVFNLTEKLASVEVDPGQMSQVIQNLVLNAIQAMPDGGSITITAHNIELKDETTFPISAGSYVLICVNDHGVGIPPDKLDRIFDPFYTTKVKGSGLGLAVCYSIIQQHNGYINVESRVGEGTCFYVYIPATNQHLVQNRSPENLRGEYLLPSAKPLKILVMDDESFLRNMLKRLLLKLGHEVEVAAEGEQAYQLYLAALEDRRPFDIVLLDLTVPGGLGGQQTFAKLREIDPQVRAVVCSGYSSDPIMSNFQEFGYKAVLPKPYHIQDLKQVLAKLAESSNGYHQDIAIPQQ